ncbi:DNA mismatch repair endonuclease MutL [Robiginitalea marina]|uniref:DNA mismatch repair protein MutL n=1 Tax=Robiginitalea marina TaxID=2954105 RepID=A0ABT1AZH2_9FLAO|nr:DNA mismatch repair endonuclease MutL [Robiginitalea marina]MCO5725449.1 DNA mismatch repair endonuclease MutL [Robiginitalea marina]
MADRIQLLPEHVANQIAAGEVVQRPASVVKELMENAIDAGADQIQLVVRDGGKALVQVVDNGAGMSPADARLSIQRHATSKIREAEDLFRIHTKGFRGEALASIAAIARLELQTRPGEADLGTHLKVSGGKELSVEETVAPKGTSISVKNLFFNIPARRNFLKSPRVEFRHVLDEFQRIALAHPEVGFSLHHDEAELYQLPASNLRKRIGHLFGNRMQDRLVPVEEDTQVVRVSGFVCKPEFARKSRGEQFFFVNSRFVKSSYLHHAVLNAFEGLLRPETVPGYFLFLEVPPESIDINIHPTKTEIKFEDEKTVYAILRSAIKHSLGQFSIRPVLDFDSDPNLQTPYSFRERDAVTPGVTVDRDFNPFAEPGSPSGRTGPVGKPVARGWEVLYEGLQEGGPAAREGLEWTVESDARDGTLFPGEALQDLGGIASFQIDRKYILTPVKSGLLLIDQHRAHQRVLYEQFLKSLSSGQPVSQALLFPLRLEFGPGEMQVLEGLREPMAAMGFRFGKQEGKSLEVVGLPAMIPESEAESVVDGLIAGWQRQEGEIGFSTADRMAKMLSRALAIPPGKVLDAPSRQALIHDLFACTETRRSPFDKIIHTSLTVEELEKKLH